MKVTILSSLPPLKGISKYTAAFVQGLHELCEIEVINFNRMYPEFLYPGGTKDKSLKPVELPNVNIKSLLNWYNPLGWIYAGLTIKGDIVHAQWWSYVLAPIYVILLFTAKYIRRKKIIITVHNVEPHEPGIIKRFANRSVYSLADHFIVHTDENKKKLIGMIKKRRSEISVLPHGILLPGAPSKGITKKEARKNLGILEKSKVLLFFGIIRDYKGLDVLLEALVKVKELVPNTFLIIAGKPWESWEKYQKIIETNKLQNLIRADLKFIPEDEIEIYFKASDLVVLPYKHFDAQSGAGALALPFKKPLLVTNTGGLTDFVLDDRALCSPKDPTELAMKIQEIFSNKNLAEKLRQDSAKLSVKLDWSTIGKNTKIVYEGLVS